MRKSLVFGVVVVIAIGIIMLISQSPKTSSFETLDNYTGEISIYKSLTCGCCSIYSGYADNKINPKVNAFDVQDTYQIKEDYGVPPELESCHTTIISDYFVEGHIPLEAIEKLMKEQPDIKGIAMPGMPSGSPGMPGQKYDDFIIYAVHHDGSYNEFMRI